MTSKIINVILMAMILTQFALYHDLDVKCRMRDQLYELRWKAQLEAFKVYSKAINDQSEFLMRVAESEV